MLLLVLIAVAGVSTTAMADTCSNVWQQCGGMNWIGPKCCVSNTQCSFGNPWYSQCLPCSQVVCSKQSSTSSKPPRIVFAPKTSTVATSTKSAAPMFTPNAQRLGGVNLAGFDFGMSVWGWSGTYVAPPMAQIQHFVAAGSNVFRLPFGWQYMEPAGPGTGLAGIVNTYDTYVQAVLATGSFAILDVHNYGRWNSGVIGRDGPSTAQFARLWSALASKYKGSERVIFGIMNEPHDQDITDWVPQVQAAVNAIRTAGAQKQYILLPGIGWTGGGSFVSVNEPALSKVTDPIGGTGKLVYDIHQYLDGDSSGTNAECVSDKITQIFSPVTSLLQAKGRKAFLSEVGGGNTASCQTHLNAVLGYVVLHSDQWLGFTTWSAGAFATSYELSEVPDNNGADRPIFANAVRPNLPGRT